MKANEILSDTLQPSEAARVLNRSAQGVRYLEDIGRLTSIRVGLRGIRLYRRHDVEVLAERAVVVRPQRAGDE